MISHRPSLIVLLLALLSACDSADSPPKPADPVADASAVSAPVAAPATAAKKARSLVPAGAPVEADPEFKPEIQLPKPEKIEPHAQAAPIEPKALETPEAPKKPQAAQPPRPSSKAVAVVKSPVPAAKLDLSLPKEVLENLEPVNAADEMDSALLPQLFNEKVAENPFQLNGRLITKDRQDDIEGAELQFEFKR